MCSGMFLGFGFSLHYHPVELLGFFWGVTPCWEDTGLWWLRLAGVSPNHGGQSLVLVGLLLHGFMGCSGSSAPILAWLEATHNDSGFVLCLQFRALFLLGVQQHWPGWGQGRLAPWGQAGLAALSEGTVGLRRGTITSPQPSCGTWACRAREDCSH